MSNVILQTIKIKLSLPVLGGAEIICHLSRISCIILFRKNFRKNKQKQNTLTCVLHMDEN